MEYTPRYAQPFTLAEAKALDVSLITEEIARLQNSLHHLRQTQQVLREHVENSNNDNESDPEILQAIEENTTVIGSQEERITILRMALSERASVSDSHYDLPAEDQATLPTAPRTSNLSRHIDSESPAPSSANIHENGLEDDDGIYL